MNRAKRPLRAGLLITLRKKFVIVKAPILFKDAVSVQGDSR